MARGSADFRSIYEKVLLSPRFQNAAFLRAKLKYSQAKKVFFDEFNKHPVTKEISGGPDAANVSGTLGGYGNLFSFLGFEEGRDPIGEVLGAMENLFSFQKSVSTSRSITFKITYPDINKLKPYSPLAWAFGGSWVSGIEKGIPNFARYLYDDDILSSRSGSGIEAKKAVREASFSATPYLSPIIEKFKTQINSK